MVLYLHIYYCALRVFVRQTRRLVWPVRFFFLTCAFLVSMFSHLFGLRFCLRIFLSVESCTFCAMILIKLVRVIVLKFGK